MSKTAIIIAGPTAVGKTDVAIEVAKYLQTQIISADSRQCFKELNIGVARPSPADLNEVPHHFIASHSIHEKITAATFEQYALEKANEIFKRNDWVVVVGGTGLYINAFQEGLDEIPEIPEEIRNEIVEDYYRYGLEWLQQTIQLEDPFYYKKGEIKNPQRLMRALEVKRWTGTSVTELRKGNNTRRNFLIKKFVLNVNKEQLNLNISQRVDKMIKEGLLEEIKSLLPYQHLNALQTVGYKEIFSFLHGEIDFQLAVEKIKINSRQYAKRQLTWFKKDKEYLWLKPDAEQLLANID
ncbi:MAG: tRNA (adenosine(37)-N6)-dimethylallyltransferase MiaA [Chitinophagaceae bacterium]